MKYYVRFRPTLPILSIALCLVFLAPVTAQSPDSGNAKVDITQVRVFGQTTLIPYSGSSLARNNGGVFATFSTSQLSPGSVVSLWWVFFNNPKFCATEGCSVPDLFVPEVNASLHNAGAAIVGLDGRFTIASYKAVGDVSAGHILPGMPDPSPGLVDAKGAAIHLAVRSHGAASADPVVLAQQLTQFNGGCPPNMCVNLQVAVHDR
ncbi:MAG TPA: hypothetical protein VFZ23_17150 [Pyrinomonadaceae bacterium]